MTDLSHWDFKEHFSGYEAAGLILGIEPREFGKDRHRIGVVTERMEIDYHRAIQSASYATVPFDDDINVDLFPSAKDGFLLSLKLIQLCGLAKNGNSEPFDQWFQHGASDFDSQSFSREAIAQWLSAIGMSSVYAFDLETNQIPIQDATDLVPQEVALKTKERNTLLCMIAALCKEAKIPFENHAKAAGLIQSAAQHMGVSIGETTIEEHLKKIPNALATRMK